MDRRIVIKKIIIQGMGYFYFVAGINHFFTPDFYIPLIPPFFPNPELVNILAGIAEVILGLGILFYPTRSKAAWGIILMLLAFIPAHWYFIEINTCVDGGLCVPAWIGWVRLVIIHPILIYWAYWVSKNPKIYV